MLDHRLKGSGPRALAIWALLSVAACGGAGQPSPPRPVQSSCPNAIQWQHQLYLGERGSPARSTRVEPIRGRRVCGPERAARVEVQALPGVPRALALGVKGERDRVYVAVGYLRELQVHPLYRPDATLRFRACGEQSTVAGTVLEPPPALRLRTGRRELQVVARRRAEVRGFRRAGYPFLQRGDSLELEGRSCTGSDGERTYVASRVRPTP